MRSNFQTKEESFNLGEKIFFQLTSGMYVPLRLGRLEFTLQIRL